MIKMTKRYKPLFGKMFYAIWAPMAIFMIAMTVMSASYLSALLIMLAADIFTFYFFFSSLVAYVELREDSVFIKFGYILKRDIPYRSIRKITRERSFYADSMLSVKNSLVHINIRYNKFDLVCVSVEDNGELLCELEARRSAALASGEQH